MSEYSFILLVTSFITMFIGTVIAGIPRSRAWNKTTKKLGYGPIPIGQRIQIPYFSKGRNFWWPKEYYSYTIPGKAIPTGPIKPEYQSKVDAWIAEFNNNKKGNHYIILGWLIVFISVSIMFLIFLNIL